MKEINFSVNLNFGAIPNGGPASSKFEKSPPLEKIKGGSCPALDKSYSFLLLSKIPITIVTNIPLEAVSHISSLRIFKSSAAEKIVLLKHR